MPDFKDRWRSGEFFSNATEVIRVSIDNQEITQPVIKYL